MKSTNRFRSSLITVKTWTTIKKERGRNCIMRWREKCKLTRKGVLKPTFSGLYIRWESFCPKKRKISLIKTLTHRALMICSESKLNDEVEFITGTLCNNYFPKDIFRSVIRNKISDLSKIKPVSVQRCPAYLR